MQTLILILTLLLLIGWFIAEFKEAHASVRVLAGVALLFCVAYAGYLGGRFHEAVKWAWVPKEHNFMFASMQRVEELLATGETRTVSLAVATYNKAAKASTNEFGYYQASLEMWQVLK